MIFEVKYRDEKGQFYIVELSAPSKLDAYIKFMKEYPKTWEIASVKRAKSKKKIEHKHKVKKRLVSFTISPTEIVI